MTDDGYFQVRNWDKFQHRDALRSDNFPWIRLHRQLLHDYDFHRLEEDAQLFLMKCWLLADRDGHFTTDTAELAFKFRVSTKRVENLLATLLQGEWLILMGNAATLPADCQQPAIGEGEREERERRGEGDAREALADFNTIRERLKLKPLTGKEHKQAVRGALGRGHTLAELRQAAAAAATDEWVLSTSNLSPIHVFRPRNMSKYLDRASSNGTNPADVQLANRLEQFRREREVRGEA